MKKAIVVGATSGIGKGIAKLLVMNDYIVGITGRRSHLLDELMAENSDRFISSNFDITDSKVVPKYLDDLTQRLGGLDLLIISSGIGGFNEELNFEIPSASVIAVPLGASSFLV